MATGNKDNFVIYQDGFQTGALEVLEQEVGVLNAGPRGIVIVTENTRGEYLESAFFTNVDGLVSDRDPSSLAAVTPTGLNQQNVKDIVVNYKIGPHADTLDAFRKISESPDLMSYLLGQMAGAQLAERYLNGGLGALVAAMSTETGMVLDTRVSGGATTNPVAGKTSISVRALNFVLGLMGDKRSRVRMWVMPSAVHTELLDNQVVEKLGEVSGSIIYGGAPGTYGLPAFVTDSPALTFEQDVSVAQDASALVTRHRVLGLTEQALVIQEQSYFDMATEIKTGGENIVAQWQGESSYLVRVKGFSWTGSNAPTTGQLATDTNWSYVFQSVKAGPGVMLVVDDIDAGV